MTEFARGLAVLAVALTLSACGSSTASLTTVSVHTGAPAPAAVADLQQSFVTVIHRVAPSVVQISTPQGLGSGVVFDNRGDVVTNAHVVSGGGPVTVTDAHGRAFPASVVGSFTPDDLAVVHAANSSLRAGSFAGAGALQVGDIVLAIGNPLGLRSSVTQGIVSALGRTVDEPNGVVLPNAIQTSAPINPGNSGGALVDLQGDVVGIPTLAAADPQLGGGAAPGIGFAIPSPLVTDIAGQLVQHGHVVASHRALLGVELAAGGQGTGAVVAAVQPGGPAARAGIKTGDVITAIDGQPVNSPVDVADALATLSAGQTVSIDIVRSDGSHATLKVKLGEYPGSAG